MGSTLGFTMTIYAKDVQHLPMFQYFELPESSRSDARKAVLDQEIRALRRDIQIIRDLARQDINTLVNGQQRYYGIPAALNHSRHINRLRNDVDRLEKIIDDNYCQFLQDGTYVVWSQPIV